MYSISFSSCISRVRGIVEAWAQLQFKCTATAAAIQPPQPQANRCYSATRCYGHAAAAATHYSGALLRLLLNNVSSGSNCCVQAAGTAGAATLLFAAAAEAGAQVFPKQKPNALNPLESCSVLLRSGTSTLSLMVGRLRLRQPCTCGSRHCWIHSNG